MMRRAMFGSAFAFVIGGSAIMLWPEPGYERVLPRADARASAWAHVMPATAGDACTPAMPAPKVDAEI